MKLKHPTHDPKPMDALSYYLQVQREYALAREGYLRIDEADDTYNDLNRKIIDAYGWKTEQNMWNTSSTLKN